MSKTTIWGYPATLRLDLGNDFVLELDQFLNYTTEGTAELDVDRILTAVTDANLKGIGIG